MEIVYSPSFIQKTDLLHANCLCGYHAQVLELLLEVKEITSILFLPHPNTTKEYNKIILDAINPPPPAQT
ncbi:hypothetical protein B6S12_07940 [Helicobacter valdiviensis]|uniref:Uncharacterized protein n=1 Tax=Helicobacter valdiviensis TaxID=1458358 RepID=A0A2W6MSX9_9HELI|nr:hypothetical protein [Helicobacter valdiviensis]PZT47654.1 hypothetical protein B6S12_07940 [Helicobacter valdiviensis]